MKKILFLATYNLGVRTGGGLATLAYYNALNCLYPNHVDLMMPNEYCNGKYGNAIKVPSRSIIKVISSGSIHRYKSQMNDYLSQYAEDYDLCVINGGIYAGDMIGIIHHFGIKVLVIHHNFEREYQMDNNTPFALWGLSPFLVNINEKRAYLQSDLNCFLTLEDKEQFEKIYGARYDSNFVIHVFEPETMQDSLIFNDKENCIAITGSLDTVQTIVGIEDFRNNYLNIFKDLCPDWKVLVAGRNPGKKIIQLKDSMPDTVDVIPNPVDMSELLKKVSIFLCPTNVGGGLKLRVMDGLRMGIPILVHKVSARGYDAFFDKPFFKIYYDQKSFREGLEALKDYCRTSCSNQEIYQTYMSEFGFEQGCIRIKSVIEKVLNR